MLGVIIGVFAVWPWSRWARAGDTVTEQVRGIGSNLITVYIRGAAQNSRDHGGIALEKIEVRAVRRSSAPRGRSHGKTAAPWRTTRLPGGARPTRRRVLPGLQRCHLPAKCSVLGTEVVEEFPPPTRSGRDQISGTPLPWSGCSRGFGMMGSDGAKVIIGEHSPAPFSERRAEHLYQADRPRRSIRPWPLLRRR